MTLQIVLLVVVIIVLVVVARSMRIAAEWQRAVVLRLGRFHKTKGPGIYLVFPADRSRGTESSICASRPPRSRPSRR